MSGLGNYASQFLTTRLSAFPELECLETRLGDYAQTKLTGHGTNLLATHDPGGLELARGALA